MSRAAGFSLVEVSIALGIAAFALVAIFGLLPVGINSTHASIQQTIATNIATALVADLRQAPAGANAASPRYNVDVTQSAASTLYLDESGEKVPPETARFKVTVRLAPPASNTRRATCGHVTIGWPAGAANPANSVSVFVALDRN